MRKFYCRPQAFYLKQLPLRSSASWGAGEGNDSKVACSTHSADFTRTNPRELSRLVGEIQSIGKYRVRPTLVYQLWRRPSGLKPTPLGLMGGNPALISGGRS